MTKEKYPMRKTSGYFSLEEIATSEHRKAMLLDLSDRYDWKIDFTEFGYSRHELKKLSDNLYTDAYELASKELGAKVKAMPMGLIYFTLNEYRIIIVPSYDKVVFEHPSHSLVVKTWKITKNEVLKAVNQLDK